MTRSILWGYSLLACICAWHGLILCHRNNFNLSYAVRIQSLDVNFGDRDRCVSGKATGETYCLAHHLTIDDQKRQLMIAALRYYDTFVKFDNTWLFAERLLYVDWIEERVLS